MINTFMTFLQMLEKYYPTSYCLLEFLHIKHPFSWHWISFQFFFFHCSFTHCILYVPNHFYLSMWMLLNEQAKRRNPKMDLIWTCEGRTLWRRKLDPQLGISKGINILVLYTIEYTHIQNVIFNIVFITKSKLK